MANERLLREKVLKYWSSLSKEDLKRDRKDLLGNVAKELKMPKELVKKLIGDWQAGRNA